MFNEYNTSNLSKTIKKIIAQPIIEYALSRGGFIAGGFSRCAMFYPESIKNYLLGKKSGDIDIFFPDVESYRATCDYAMNYCLKGCAEDPLYATSNSLTGFCTNILLPASEFFENLSLDKSTYVYNIDHEPIKIQLVNVFHGDQQSVLDTFDIENCKVSIGKKSLYVSKEVEDLENSKTIKVVHNTSPLLPIRIKKYIYSRGLVNVHPHSSELMRNWLISWLYNSWDDHPLSNMFLKCKRRSYHKDEIISLLRHEKLVASDQLSLLFGSLNYDVREYCGYSTYWRTIDPVKNELKRRKLLT